MNEIEFVKWPSIGRMNQDMTITEKIDGTNGAIRFVPAQIPGPVPDNALCFLPADNMWLAVQSRSRFITPDDDNYGLAQWAWDNANGLYDVLGEGTHFGEWWGKGINRGYGLNERRFSLFNTKRWNENGENVPGLYSVPVLITCKFSQLTVVETLASLRIYGSVAEPGFMRPEGVVVYHHGIGEYMKVTLDHDGPKSS